MTEKQFISELENAMRQLPGEERNDILHDIREYFTNGREDGKTESEIANSLGSPAKIAEELLDSYSFDENETRIPAEDSDELITITDNSYTNVDINVQHGALVVRPSNDTITTVELIGPNEKFELTAQVIGDTSYSFEKSTPLVVHVQF